MTQTGRPRRNAGFFSIQAVLSLIAVLGLAYCVMSLCPVYLAYMDVKQALTTVAASFSMQGQEERVTAAAILQRFNHSLQVQGIDFIHPGNIQVVKSMLQKGGPGFNLKVNYHIELPVLGDRHFVRLLFRFQEQVFIPS